MWSYSVLPIPLPSKHCHLWRREARTRCSKQGEWFHSARNSHPSSSMKSDSEEHNLTTLIGDQKTLIKKPSWHCGVNVSSPLEESCAVTPIDYLNTVQNLWRGLVTSLDADEGSPKRQILMLEPCCPWCYIKWRSNKEGWGSMQGSPHRTHVQGPTADHYRPGALSLSGMLTWIKAVLNQCVRTMLVEHLVNPTVWYRIWEYPWSGEAETTAHIAPGIHTGH